MKPRKIFISSVTHGNKELREQLYQLSNETTAQLWVAEICRPDLACVHPFDDPLVIIDTLLDELKSSDLVLVVLGSITPDGDGKDHGTLIPIGRKISNVSYFEIELYQAALLGKPIKIIVADQFNPSPRMAALLSLFRAFFPEESWKRKSDKTIIEQVRDIIGETGQQLQPAFPTVDLSRLVEKLWSSGQNNMLFLGGEFDGSRSKLPDLEVIEHTLTHPTVNVAGGTVTHDKQLARVWIALRELMSVSYLETKNPEFLALWNQALGRWSEPAAWYGLHGHLLMGCLAAINSTSIVRKRLRQQSQGKDLPLEQLQEPGGAKASALYSIGKLLPHWHQQRKLFHSALDSINGAFQSEQTDISGLKLVRASINLRLLHPFRAVQDYEEALEIRLTQGEDEGRIGEALVELGFAYILTARLFKGRERIQEGVAMLTRVERTEFLIRAKRKLAWAYKITGRTADALREEGEARRLAEKSQTLDQKRQIH